MGKKSRGRNQDSRPDARAKSDAPKSAAPGSDPAKSAAAPVDPAKISLAQGDAVLVGAGTSAGFADAPATGGPSTDSPSGSRPGPAALSAARGSRSPLQFLADGVLGLLSSVLLGVCLLAFILLWVAAGTLDIVLTAADFEMLEWYVWPPFLGVLYLLCLNLAVVTIRRIPFNLPNLGVWVIHGSILVLAAGATWFGLTWTDAVTRIDRGRTQSNCYSLKVSDEALHVWRLPDAPGASRPDYDDGTGFGRNDLSEQEVLPRLTRHQRRGGVELTEGLLRDLIPEPEVAARLRKSLLAAGAPGEVADRLDALEVLRGGDKNALRVRLEGAFTKEERAQWTLLERSLLARSELEERHAALRQIRPRRIETAQELRGKVATAMGSAGLSPRQVERLDALAEDDYLVGPVTLLGGLRFYVDRSWPRVDIDEKPLETIEDADLSAPAVLTAFGDSNERVSDTRRILRAGDGSSLRTDFPDRTEMLDRFADAMRSAYGAAAAGDSKAAAQFAANADDQLRNEAALRDARVILQVREAIPQAEMAVLRRFYRDPRTLTPERFRERGTLALQPPRPAELVVITDPRFRSPISLPLEEWIRTGRIELDHIVGRDGNLLAGESLELVKVLDDADKAALFGIRHVPVTDGVVAATAVRYRLVRNKAPVWERVFFLHATLNTALIDGDLIRKTGADGIRKAQVAATEETVVRLVPFPTAVIQCVNFGYPKLDPKKLEDLAAANAIIKKAADLTGPPEAGREPEQTGAVPNVVPTAEDERPLPDRLVWSVQEGSVPYLPQGQGGNSTEVFRLVHGDRGEWLHVGRSLRFGQRMRIVPRFGVTSGKDSNAPALNAIRVRAEYDLPGSAGRPAETWTKTFWLLKTSFPDIDRAENPDRMVRLDVPGLGPVAVAWAGLRIPIGSDGALRARLEDFRVHRMPGSTEQHKEYASFVTFADHTGSAVAEAGSLAGERTATVKVCMNEPKKADGWWFSQNSYDPKLRWSVFSVAHKPAWSDPPVVPFAMATMLCGVLWAFTVKPMILRRRRERMRRLAGSDGDE